MNLEEISFIIIVAVLGAFYLMFIRPATKEQNRQGSTIRNLRVGDEIETTAGFIGVVSEINTPEEGPVRLVIDFGNNVKVQALTTSVLRRLSSAEERQEPSQSHGSLNGQEASPSKARKS